MSVISFEILKNHLEPWQVLLTKIYPFRLRHIPVHTVNAMPVIHHVLLYERVKLKEIKLKALPYRSKRNIEKI